MGGGGVRSSPHQVADGLRELYGGQPAEALLPPRSPGSPGACSAPNAQHTRGITAVEALGPQHQYPPGSA